MLWIEQKKERKRIYVIKPLFAFTLSFFILIALSFSCAEKETHEELKADILLSMQNLEIFEGEEVYFNAQATGGQSPYSYSWVFGAGIPSSSEKEPGLIAFNFEGAYKVILSVKDSKGNHREDYVYINVKKKDDLAPKN